MADLVLVGKGWKARVLLRAQLSEQGVKVEAHESLKEAFQGLGRSAPVLLVADLSESDDPSADIRQLAMSVTGVPIWIIASRSTNIEFELASSNFERVFFLPVHVGELASLIEQRIKA